MNVLETTQENTQTLKQDQGLQDLVYSLVTRFLAENKAKSIDDLYDMILSEVEPPLLQAVMEKRRGNQLQAAKILWPCCPYELLDLGHSGATTVL